MVRPARRRRQLRFLPLLGLALAIAAIAGTAVTPAGASGPDHHRTVTGISRDLHREVGHLPSVATPVVSRAAKGLPLAIALAAVLFLASGRRRARPLRLLVVEPGRPRHSSHGDSARLRGPPAPPHQ